MLMKISPDAVTTGMFIHGFDGNWLSHPFWMTRFLLTEDRDLARIRDSGVAKVVIDTEKGLSPGGNGPVTAPTAAAVAKAQPRRIEEGRTRSLTRIKATLASESPAADAAKIARRQTRRVVNASAGAARALFDGVRQGVPVSSEAVLEVVDDIATCVHADRSIILDMIRLKDKDQYTYIHSVAVCALMVNVAGELGMDEEQARALGTAGFLHDIGKSTIDAELLNKTSALTEAERSEIRRHPKNGHGLLVAAGGMAEDVLDVCLSHHERLDGSGYPHGLEGAQISVPVRLAAICDVYDALISDRSYRPALMPAAAIAYLDDNTAQFDRMLLFAFMKSIGVFPANMLVRLRSNQLGIVLASTKPKAPTTVRVFWSIADHAHIEPYDIVPSHDLGGDQIVSREQPVVWGLTDWDAMRDRIVRHTSFGKRRSK